ncbi:Uncharacterized protein FKW44_017076 [Caligus rogercresseyi]|uniref:Pyroglutamyl-peptidase 1 n=1 Tax=Caligus rogercresseyi TaxID=217165 RepID=A0A7T8H3B5_CALRO|nr:Uncharacterized protein FKW44_017076 [Caligus rogercresseyi]
MIHVGVSSQAQGVVLEEVSCNEGYQRGDVVNKVPGCNKCIINCKDPILKTRFNTKDIIKDLNDQEWNDMRVSASKDAGRYLCEFVYYKSLSQTKGSSLFIHVPPLSDKHTDKKLAKAICFIVKGALKQILGSSKK